MKKWVLRLLVVIALLWAGWWWLITGFVASSLSSAFERPNTGGWRFEAGTVASIGFPFRLGTRLEALKAIPIGADAHFDVPQLEASTPIYWPGYLTVDLPTDPVLFKSGEMPFRLSLQNGTAQLNLAPNTALSLQTIRVKTRAISVLAGKEVLLTADDLHAEISQHEAISESYAVDLDVLALAPGVDLRKALRLPATWPTAFEAFELSGEVLLNRALDRHVADGPRPQPLDINLDGLAVKWGAIDLRAQGAVSMDALGVPNGRVDMVIGQWQDLANLLQSIGVLTDNKRLQFEFAARVLSSSSANPEDLNIPLIFSDGRMALGPIDLGPAPAFRFN